MPDMEQLFSQWARQAQEPENEDDERGRERVELFDFNHLARGPWEPEDSEDDDSDSEFGWGDCDGNHPDGEHCEICASSFDCYCYECYANGAHAGDDSFHYYYRLFYWYYYCFYMDYYAIHYAERVTRGSQSRHDRDDYL
ncbi:hypothetical protein ACHAPX_008882 [Trichoderma viride]